MRIAAGKFHSAGMPAKIIGRLDWDHFLPQGRPHIAVLGGGFQGVSVALALRERGARVTIFEREQALIQRTSIVGEAKIHLGYIFAADPTFATAKTLIRGAFAFSELVGRWLDEPAGSIGVSSPFKYVAHCDSSMPVEALVRHFGRVRDEMIRIDAGQRRYFGSDAEEPIRLLTRAERETLFGEPVLAAFDTPEIAVNMIELAARLRARVAGDPGIELRLGFEVDTAREVAGGVEVRGTDGGVGGRFGHVVNALWDERLAVDASRGIRAGRQWIHRRKYGIRFPLPEGATPVPSVSMVHGPFGDSVLYNDGMVYLSWYPACMVATSLALKPAWPRLDAGQRDRIVSETFRAIGEVVTPVGQLDVATLFDIQLVAGTIVAWGKTDIEDRESELHRRNEIGIESHGAYHSIDTGKLTMVPYFAESCAQRIMGR
jgi:glycine/D-amino acid oxidase-like deaminating enzyme